MAHPSLYLYTVSPTPVVPPYCEMGGVVFYFRAYPELLLHTPGRPGDANSDDNGGSVVIWVGEKG